MKHFTLFIAFFAFAITSFSQTFSKTEQAIVNTIMQETEGWWQRDHAKWSDAWAHESYISWSGTTNVMRLKYEGWDELNAFVSENFEKYPDPNSSRVERDNWQFRIYKNGAWVRFTQKSEGISQEIRILEKHKGKWKLVHVGWINDSSFEDSATEANGE